MRLKLPRLIDTSVLDINCIYNSKTKEQLYTKELIGVIYGASPQVVRSAIYKHRDKDEMRTYKVLGKNRRKYKTTVYTLNFVNGLVRYIKTDASRKLMKAMSETMCEYMIYGAILDPNHAGSDGIIKYMTYRLSTNKIKHFDLVDAAIWSTFEKFTDLPESEQEKIVFSFKNTIFEKTFKMSVKKLALERGVDANSEIEKIISKEEMDELNSKSFDIIVRLLEVFKNDGKYDKNSLSLFKLVHL